MSQLKSCFVVSQIGEAESEQRHHADAVLNHIIKPALSTDFDVKRVDEIYHSDKIDDKIFNHLHTSDLVVVDITDSNPNVFLELGYRLALKKPTIYICQKSTTPVPFDIRTINIIFYDLTADGTKMLDNISEAKNRIAKTAKTLDYISEDAESTEDPLDKLLKETADIKSVVNHIFDNLDQSASPSNQANISIQEQMLLMGMEEPDKLERFIDLISRYQSVFQAQ